MVGNINSLPKWARDLFLVQKRKLDCLSKEIATLRQAHTILTGTHWFTVNGPPENAADIIKDGRGTKDDKVYRLFFLAPDGAHQVCALGPEDMLLVGRKKSA